MTREHYLLLAGFLAAVGAQLAALDHWIDATSPAWVGALIVQIGLMVRGFYSKPNVD